MCWETHPYLFGNMRYAHDGYMTKSSSSNDGAPNTSGVEFWVKICDLLSTVKIGEGRVG